MIPFLTTAENFRLVKATGFSFTALIVALQWDDSTVRAWYEPLYVTSTVCAPIKRVLALSNSDLSQSSPRAGSYPVQRFEAKPQDEAYRSCAVRIENRSPVTSALLHQRFVLSG